MKQVCFPGKTGMLVFCALSMLTVSGGLLYCDSAMMQQAAVIGKRASLPCFDDQTMVHNVFQQRAVEIKSGSPHPVRNEESGRLPVASRGERVQTVFQGIASWYGGEDGLDHCLTASGERYNPTAFTAAHRTLPFGTKVRVTYLRTGISTVVRINDRGPFIDGRIIDLSRAAAEAVGMLSAGTGAVEIEVLE